MQLLKTFFNFFYLFIICLFFRILLLLIVAGQVARYENKFINNLNDRFVIEVELFDLFKIECFEILSILFCLYLVFVVEKP